jgi:hypothetical protein
MTKPVINITRLQSGVNQLVDTRSLDVVDVKEVGAGRCTMVSSQPNSAACSLSVSAP